MKYKSLLLICVLFASLMLAAGCGGSSDAQYKDGVFKAISSNDDKGAYGEVTVTVKDGQVTDCQFVTYKKDGTIKGEDYGKVNGAITNRDYYEKAQLSVRAMQKYADDFKKAKSLKGVEAVTGATVSYNQFVEAIDKALAQAKK